MSTSVQDIDRLLPVLETAFQAEQMKMARVARRIADLQQSLADLARPKTEPLSAATLAGADLRWDAWAHERKLAINRQLALVFVERERMRKTMIAALAKLEAAKQVQKRAHADVRQIAQRRASW
ncbi:MAG: hypothetical protein ACSHWY_11585 [Octadecabacter sp.]